jgi:tRNA threonylcarbamoyladenosine biosynthesis protein TsaE
MEIVFTLPELPGVAARFLKSIPGQKVIALHGEMGAGKTTFSTAFCQAIGVRGTVNSPTFSLVNEYHTPSGMIIYHMDWYRLRDEAEALLAGMEEYLYSGALCLVEWPERAPGILPPDTLHAYLEVLDPQTRRFTANVGPSGMAPVAPLNRP